MSIFYLEGISKTYKSGNSVTKALSDITLSFPNSGLISIVGKSGSGKSTLLNILLGIEKPSKGSVYFNNEKINRFSKAKFSVYHLYYTSMVFQHYNLFDDLSPFDNVALPLKIRGEKKDIIKKKVNELFSKFHLNYLINQKTSTLSGGERQRIAILRSLVTSPKVILCDEPTGALDSINSSEIMNLFKEISKSILVIMVSHNLEIVNKYSDRIITLKDGRIISDTSPIYKTRTFVNKIKKNYSNKWTNFFLRKNLKENKHKNVFSILSLIFGFLAIMISVGFYNGSKSSESNMLFSNLACETMSVSEKNLYKVNNSSLSYIKSTRPSEEIMDEFHNIFPNTIIDFNYGYLFSSFPETSFNKRIIDSPEMIPIYSFNNNSILNELVTLGEIPLNDNLNEVVVNEEFISLLGIDKSDALSEEIYISFSKEVSVLTDDLDNPIIKDTYSYSLNLVIKAVIHEFSFLNSPKIYYSHLALKEDLSNYIMENLSTYKNKVITFNDYMYECSSDSEISNYSYNVFSSDKEEIRKLSNYKSELDKNENGLSITSNAFEISNSYTSFMDSFSSALIVFVSIAFVGVNFILGMLALSSFISRKKESAILTCLGAKDISIISIFLKENYILIFVAFLIASALSCPLSILMNLVLEKSFGLTSLIKIPYLSFLNIPYIFLPLLLLVFIFVSTLFLLIPILIYKNKSTVNELRDE